MRRLYLFLFAVILGSFLFGKPVFAGSTFELTPAQVNVKEGETFELKAIITPPSVKNYTARLVVQFPPELINVKSWVYEPHWIAVRKSGYDVLNNDQGIFIRTAGYPDGFDARTVMGTVTFVAKKSGVASLRITSESFVLDQNSNNIATLGGPVKVQIDTKVVVVDQKPRPLASVKETSSHNESSSSKPSVPEESGALSNTEEQAPVPHTQTDGSEENQIVPHENSSDTATSTAEQDDTTTHNALENTEDVPPALDEESDDSEEKSGPEKTPTKFLVHSKFIFVWLVLGLTSILLILIFGIRYLIAKFSKKQQN